MAVNDKFYSLIKIKDKSGAIIYKDDIVSRFILPVYSESQILSFLTKEYPQAVKRNKSSSLVKKIYSYFDGTKIDFNDVKIDFTTYTDFQISVLRELRKIKWGKTVTYGELAKLVGKPSAARAVGSVMRANRAPLLIPCHRVLAKNGLGGYSGGLHLKKKLLSLEGKII